MGSALNSFNNSVHSSGGSILPRAQGFSAHGLHLLNPPCFPLPALIQSSRVRRTLSDHLVQLPYFIALDKVTCMQSQRFSGKSRVDPTSLDS